MENKKGLSTVIAVLLMILLVLTSVSIVWGIVNKLITEEIDGSDTCFSVSTEEKITLESRYTCYDNVSKEFQFSIKIGDIEIDELKIGISDLAGSQTFTLTNTGQTFSYLKNYSKIYSSPVKLPEKNSGKTYLLNTTDYAVSIDFPKSIEILPIINGKDCGITDSLYKIDDCAFLIT